MDISQFEQLGISYIESMSNFVLGEIESEAQSVYEKLLQKGIIVRQGNAWGLPNHLRITVGNDSENHALLSALSDLIG
ncbi:aminotransferase class I/II-fold pyridoxal phosphate-dependent enzyme [Bacillus sp. SA1-12]|uniref:aminotransferase class I/II-fold pyridoxal phosphate-dependent enzyme n=1 Tax=Bacillus sp. SA1-12 TaxID=1455638 RepID=UPI0006978460|nr:aminotransferase class I/II-fold pyridoxal phosphate-dependent enzyme [Bacillus sp. SA1-12]